MKGLVLFFCLLFAISLFAQAPAIEKAASKPGDYKKIALINGNAFYSGDGIKQLFDVLQNTYQLNCFPLHWSDISDLEKELKNPDLPASERDKKETRLKTLRKEQKESLDVNYARYFKLVVDPVENEIRQYLDKVGNQNSVIILHSEKLAAKDQILAVNNKIDITDRFIAFINDRARHPNNSLKLDLPESKIAAINSSYFFDKQNGLKTFVELKDKTVNRDNFCEKTAGCLVIGKSIQSFSEFKGYNLIIDSGKELPIEIKNLPIEDVTRDFIAYYNKSN